MLKNKPRLLQPKFGQCVRGTAWHLPQSLWGERWSVYVFGKRKTQNQTPSFWKFPKQINLTLLQISGGWDRGFGFIHLHFGHILWLFNACGWPKTSVVQFCENYIFPEAGAPTGNTMQDNTEMRDRSKNAGRHLLCFRGQRQGLKKNTCYPSAKVSFAMRNWQGCRCHPTPHDFRWRWRWWEVNTLMQHVGTKKEKQTFSMARDAQQIKENGPGYFVSFADFTCDPAGLTGQYSLTWNGKTLATSSKTNMFGE